MKDILDLLKPQEPEQTVQIPFAPDVLPENYNDLAQEEAVQQAAPEVKSAAPAISRAPASIPALAPKAEDIPAAPEAAPQLSKLEQLMEERKKSLEDAAERQNRAELLAGLASHLGLIVGGAQAMNTKAHVTPAQIAPIKVPDVVGLEEKKYKPEMDQLMAEYKALQKRNEPMTEYQQQMLQHMRNQLEQSKLREEHGMERFGKTHERLSDKQAWTEKEKDEPSDKQTEQLAGYDDTLKALDRIQAQKVNVDTGPIAKTRNTIASKLGIDDPEVTSLRSEIIDTLAAKIKALSGTAANESEVKRLQITLPDIGDSDAVFERKLQDARRRIEEARKIRVDAFKKQGKNPSNFENKAEGSSSSASDHDKQAYDWAIKNSNDPRASAIIKKLQAEGKL